MRKFAALIAALSLAFTPVFAKADPPVANESDLFFTQSEEEADIDTRAHPVIWVFAAAGVFAVVCVGALTYANRRRSIHDR